MERALQELVRLRAGDRCEYYQMPQKYDRVPFEIDQWVVLRRQV